MANQKLVLFVDAQNMYQCARDAFFSMSDSRRYGQFNPVELGNLVCSRKPPGQQGDERSLHEVRIYTGRPDSSKDPKTYGAHMRQCATWEKWGATVVARTLRYPRDWPNSKSEEKGIDVALAVDFVTMAVEGEYDIGVIASTDTDLRPALEYVIKRPGVLAEVAAWRSSRSLGQLSVPGQHVWCHRLVEADYNAVSDLTDYNVKRS
jgi:uncharacterized LabA/DUF88 family protein